MQLDEIPKLAERGILAFKIFMVVDTGRDGVAGTADDALRGVEGVAAGLAWECAVGSLMGGNGTPPV